MTRNEIKAGDIVEIALFFALESGRLKNKSVVRVEKLNYISKKECRYIGTLKRESFKSVLKGVQFYFTTSYYKSIHQPSQSSEFIPVKSRINYAGRVFNERETINLIDSSLDFWLTTGRYAERFEKEFADFLGVKHCSLTNSGSSANLLAFMALTSSKLGERSIKKGDEVITVAAGFPTTVAPIIQYGAVPVFVLLKQGEKIGSS